MKKRMLILLVAAVVLLATGCAKIDQGIVLNMDGSGYIYSQNLVIEDEVDESTITNEFFNIDKASAIEQEVTKTIDGNKYAGSVAVKEFGSLEELESLMTDFIEVTKEVVKDENIITIILKSDEMNGEEADDFIKAIVEANFEAEFKIIIDGEILETTGAVNEEENSVTWDLVKGMDEDLKYLLKYKENPEGEKRNPITDGIIRPGPESMSVIMNGERIIFPDQRPVIENGRTLVPVRVISENLGIEVEWIPDKTVKLIKGNNVITLVIGEKEVLFEDEVEEKTIALDVPAKIINRRTMIPLRAVAEIFDMEVEWDQDTYTAIIFEKE